MGLKVKNDTQLGLTGTYMLTDNIGVELLAATPFSHKINANVPALNLDLGRAAIVKQLPPSLYAQYYFFNADSAVRPYSSGKRKPEISITITLCEIALILRW